MLVGPHFLFFWSMPIGWVGLLKFGFHWKDRKMVKLFPPEFRRDVVVVARKSETSLSQTAKDFGIGQSSFLPESYPKMIYLFVMILFNTIFKANKPNQLWLTDITEHHTKECELYFCAIKDVFSNKIVGYCADFSMKATLAVKVLRNAIILRSPKTTVVHLDRGSQFRSVAFRKMLANNKLQSSMGKVGACADNAAMESFFLCYKKMF